jgi:hypothetical protein
MSAASSGENLIVPTTPRAKAEKAMFTQPGVSGESRWRQMMELESRKEVIQGWLSSPDTPSHLVDVLQEMLTTTERHLQAVRTEGIDSTGSPVRRAAE